MLEFLSTEMRLDLGYPTIPEPGCHCVGTSLHYAQYLQDKRIRDYAEKIWRELKHVPYTLTWTYQAFFDYTDLPFLATSERFTQLLEGCFVRFNHAYEIKSRSRKQPPPRFCRKLWVSLNLQTSREPPSSNPLALHHWSVVYNQMQAERALLDGILDQQATNTPRYRQSPIARSTFTPRSELMTALFWKALPTLPTRFPNFLYFIRTKKSYLLHWKYTIYLF